MLNQGVSGAFYAACVAQCLQQRPDQRRLARPQVTAQIDHQTRLQCVRETCRKGRRGGLIGQVYSAMIRFMQNGVPQTDYNALAARIKAWGKALGFQAVGISDTRLDAAEAHLLQWLADGHHGAMDYMAKHGAKRARPAELVPGTLRVISVRMDYYPQQAKDSHEVLADGSRAFISRYALGRDYHKVLRNRLEKLAQQIRDEIECQCRVFTDSAPVLEVELAQKANLGWRGKHTLLLSREQGSWFFLGEIYIDLPLPVDVPQDNHCGTCNACIAVCPTQAITAPYQLDARRCISYLTIELKDSIPVEMRPLIGNRIYGCDDCQLVCPWNRFAQKTVEPDFAVRNGLDDASLAELFAWDEATFHLRLAGSAIHRIGYEQWLRNIAVALGNAPNNPEVHAALQTRTQHPSSLVREHVEWALRHHSIG
jgi:epoxyqueuosine reductase